MDVWEGYLRKTQDIKSTDLVFYNVKNSPFKVYGLWNPQVDFKRMPQEIADKVSGPVAQKNCEPSGGRIRFATDSDKIAIKVKLKSISPNPTLPPFELSAFDLYKVVDGEQVYIHTFMKPVDGQEYYEGETDTNTDQLTEYVLTMPNFNEVFDIEIGVKEKSVVKETVGYKYEKPIVFYGSSITQGAGASRSGNIYENFVSRALDANYINLGFSGNAKGEPLMAEYISKLEMSAFVLDYDHNADTVEHLENTHYPFYSKVREAHPTIPIVIITKPDGGHCEYNLKRKDVILKSYLKARGNGDKNVYFIDGLSFFAGQYRNDCTIDGCHPNDLGYSLMAEMITDVLKYGLSK